MNNRLEKEKSPYLLQHASNPVDWYPWGDEAFERAKDEDRPIFLSIGYSTCHWCHVMERESFSNPSVARLLNRAFVCVKVDREERPDIDSVYMSACHAMTGTGGWPLTIIMTPDKKPFFAATYIPRESRFGMTGLVDLLPRIEEAWRTKRTELAKAGQNLVEMLASTSKTSSGSRDDRQAIEAAYRHLASSFDEIHGGFGRAPKFPSPHNLLFLLRYWNRTGEDDARRMVERTLVEMRSGGMYDQIGFGFHRYSTDAEWFVPHFEKMLYDQAMLSMAYIEAYQASGKEEYARTAREIFTYVMRDMTSSDGGFQSAEDADSEGIEGKFYHWTLKEVRAVLSKQDADLYTDAFNILKPGNFKSEDHNVEAGVNILRTTERLSETASRLRMPTELLAERLEAARRTLLAAREKRVRPRKDDKILADWNGLMIAALAKGAQALRTPEYARVAEKAARFILASMRDEHGRLLHRYREGEAAIPGNLDDYAFMAWGLMELYEATFETEWLVSAVGFARSMMEHFWDHDNGGFYFTADDAEEVLVRQKLIYDGAMPAGNSVALMVLLRLGRMIGDVDMEEKAAEAGRAFSGEVGRHPSSHTFFVSAIDFALGPSFEVVIAGTKGRQDTEDMIKAIRSRFLPNKVVLFVPSQERNPEVIAIAPYLGDFLGLAGRATAYVCRRRNCELPTTDIEDMLRMLGVGTVGNETT